MKKHKKCTCRKRPFAESEGEKYKEEEKAIKQPTEMSLITFSIYSILQLEMFNEFIELEKIISSVWFSAL